MRTKYDVGDKVVIKAKIIGVKVWRDGGITYETDIPNYVLESDIVCRADRLTKKECDSE